MKLSTYALREKRASKQDEMKSIMAKADITAEDRSRFDALESEVRGINEDIRRTTIIETAEREDHAEPVDGGGREMGDLERRFSVGKALAEHLNGNLTGAEAEYNAERRSARKGFRVPVNCLLGERRDLTTAAPVGGPGGNLVATNLGPMIQQLRPRLVVESLGATVLTGLTGDLDLPRHKASGTAGWVAEHGAATESDPQFDKVEMSPKTATAEYEISRRMMLQAMNLDSILRADLGYLLAQAIDSAAIKGGGTNEPSGILANNSIGIFALGTNGALMTVDTATELMALVETANAFGNTGFLTNSKVKKTALKMKDSNGQIYGTDTVFRKERVEFTNQVPSNLTKGSGTGLSAILYGVWSDLVVAYWSSVDIVVNPYHSDVSSKGGAKLNAFLDADVALRHVESFAVVKDVVTT